MTRSHPGLFAAVMFVGLAMQGCAPPARPDPAPPASAAVSLAPAIEVEPTAGLDAGCFKLCVGSCLQGGTPIAICRSECQLDCTF